MLSYWDPFLGLEFLWFSFRRSQPFWLLFLPLLISSISRAFWSLRIFQTLKLYGWDLNCSSPIRFHFNNEDRVHLAQRQWSTEWTDTGPCKAILSSFQIFPPTHFLEKIFRSASGSLQLMYSTDVLNEPLLLQSYSAFPLMPFLVEYACCILNIGDLKKAFWQPGWCFRRVFAI